MNTKKQKLHLPYKDNSDLPEVFADSLELLWFNGQFAYLTLSVNRLEENTEGDEKKGYRSTAARLVMSPNLLTTLYDKLSHMINAMEREGLVTRGDKEALKGDVPSTNLH